MVILFILCTGFIYVCTSDDFTLAFTGAHKSANLHVNLFLYSFKHLHRKRFTRLLFIYASQGFSSFLLCYPSPYSLMKNGSHITVSYCCLGKTLSRWLGYISEFAYSGRVKGWSQTEATGEKIDYLTCCSVCTEVHENIL